MSSKVSANADKHMKEENRTVVIGKPKCSTRIPPNVGPANVPQKNEDDHIPK